MSTIHELIERWDSNEGKPYKGSLIDWSAYEPGNISCMCAQGQVLHLVGGRDPEWLRDADQVDADRETAKLLNISVAHAVLLRQVNDIIDGAPAIVLTDPGAVLGDQWSKLLDFWWSLDQFDDAAWAAARAAAWAAAGDAAWAAAWAAAGDAAGDAAGGAARAAARDAAGDAAGDAAWDAAWEIQGAEIFRRENRPFYFLPLFGFATLDDIPARPANYGVTS